MYSKFYLKHVLPPGFPVQHLPHTAHHPQRRHMCILWESIQNPPVVPEEKAHCVPKATHLKREGGQREKEKEKARGGGEGEREASESGLFVSDKPMSCLYSSEGLAKAGTICFEISTMSFFLKHPPPPNQNLFLHSKASLSVAISLEQGCQQKAGRPLLGDRP